MRVELREQLTFQFRCQICFHFSMTEISFDVTSSVLFCIPISVIFVGRRTRNFPHSCGSFVLVFFFQFCIHGRDCSNLSKAARGGTNTNTQRRSTKQETKRTDRFIKKMTRYWNAGPFTLHSSASNRTLSKSCLVTGTVSWNGPGPSNEVTLSKKKNGIKRGRGSIKP